ncbi:MAG TPA: DUF1501 domain-containing protein, partial [Burkholderiales bacterium]|nr:DUF1501 domain-containing protein [Burkholderiales bacterium]
GVGAKMRRRLFPLIARSAGLETAMRRRDFLRATATAGTAAAVGMSWSRGAAAAFGETPVDYQSVMLPESVRAQSILEVFMYGGVSPWETFLASDEYGKNDKRFLYAFYDRTLQACEGCGYEANEGNLLTPFGEDSAGKPAFLGPFLQPLLARPDVVERMRVVVNRHELEPHEAAIPLAMSGRTLGSPSLASLGTHVQRYFVDREVVARGAPYAYGFATAGGFIPTDNVLSLVATGLHPGSARPLLIKVDNVTRLNELLDRTTVGSLTERAKYDALMRAYFTTYEAKLRYGADGTKLRAARFHELLQASRSVENADSVKGVLDPELFVKMPGKACEDENEINVPAMSLRLATHLLTHPQTPARHCCVIDTGLHEADGGGGYDTHEEMTFTQARNLKNLLTNLLSRVNQPGEADPNKIDLDKTMIVLNQEFGRTPGAQDGSFGRNHWPYGYAQIYIGGPITKAQRGVYGSILETGHAGVNTTPTENRIAALLAMGIYPFDSAAFSNSDVQGQSNDGLAIADATRRILGYEV